MQLYKENSLQKISGILVPLERRLINCLDSSTEINLA